LPDANADLAHRYSFTSDANDSVGTAHGTVVDPGVPTAVFAAGQLDLSVNTGQNSGAITEDAYVNLPNGMFSAVAAAGTSGAFSMELWATVSATHTWQRYVDVGSSNGGEDTSGNGSMQPYIYIAPNSGRFTDGLASEAHAANQVGPATEVGQTGPLPNGVELHVVGTYDQNDTSAGANGTLKLYRNGALLGQAPIPAGLTLNTFTNNNNWLGRSQWGDPVFDGSYNEFRVYDHALTASEVGADFLFGPDVIPTDILSLTVNTSTGAVTMTNNSPIAINAEFYRISSDNSALSLAGWNSLDEQNYDAVDGTDGGMVAGDSDGEGWDEAGGSNASQLVELFLGEAGSSIAPSETISLGNAFNTSVVDGQDLVFDFGLVGGLQLTGGVEYISAPGLLGDFNEDGKVDAADYVKWRKDGANPLPNDNGLTTAAARFNLWRANFGNMSGGGAAASGASVPEPASWICSLLAAAAFAGRRRTRTIGC
jgi:hypothetical protein